MDYKLFNKFDVVCSGHYHHKSTEKNRKAGYKHIKNMEKGFIVMAKKVLEDGLI